MFASNMLHAYRLIGGEKFTRISLLIGVRREPIQAYSEKEEGKNQFQNGTKPKLLALFFLFSSMLIPFICQMSDTDSD